MCSCFLFCSSSKSLFFRLILLFFYSFYPIIRHRAHAKTYITKHTLKKRLKMMEEEEEKKKGSLFFADNKTGEWKEVYITLYACMSR